MLEDLIHRIHHEANPRGGEISSRRMLELGASRSWIACGVRAGWLQRACRGEYRIGPTTLANRRSAATSAGGDGSMIIGLHGLDLWRIRKVDVTREVIDVWSPTHHRTRGDIRFRELRWVSCSDVRRVQGQDVASPEVCIASVATKFDAVDLVALITEACFYDRGVAKRLAALIDEHNFLGRMRLATALDWYEHGHCGLDSAEEKRIKRRLRQLGAAEPLINVHVRLSDGAMRVDMYWDHAGLVLEVNPDGHKRPWVRNTDLGRAARVTRDGLQTISLDTTRSLEYQDAVLRELAARSHQPRTGPYVDYFRPASDSHVCA